MDMDIMLHITGTILLTAKTAITAHTGIMAILTGAMVRIMILMDITAAMVDTVHTESTVPMDIIAATVGITVRVAITAATDIMTLEAIMILTIMTSIIINESLGTVTTANIVATFAAITNTFKSRVFLKCILP